MTLKLDTAIKNSMLDVITAAIDAGAFNGLLRIYDGVRPSAGGTVTTLLAELTLSDPSFPAASSGQMVANSITDDSSADNTGTATWFRIVDSDGNFVMDGDVGLSDAELILDNTSIVAGVSVAITSLTISAGN